MQNFSVSILLIEEPKCWKTVKFPKVSIKTKNFQTFYDAQAAGNQFKEIT